MFLAEIMAWFHTVHLQNWNWQVFCQNFYQCYVWLGMDDVIRESFAHALPWIERKKVNNNSCVLTVSPLLHWSHIAFGLQCIILEFVQWQCQSLSVSTQMNVTLKSFLYVFIVVFKRGFFVFFNQRFESFVNTWTQGGAIQPLTGSFWWMLHSNEPQVKTF